MSGAFVCRHHERYWNAVSGDQFGEQTAIRMGKGALKGMTLSPELVCEWIDAFPITAHVTDQVDCIYSANAPCQFAQKQHILKTNKDTGVCWMQTIVDKEVTKHPHPLEDKRSHLYNAVTGQLAPEYVNVADSLLIGQRVAKCYSASLPSGLYAPISCPIKTMCDAMKSKRNPDKPATDLENICVRLIMIGQRRQLELLYYELSAVSASLIDEQGYLRKGNTCALVKRLGVIECMPPTADIVIVDVQQLLYRIVWPHGGSPSDVIESNRRRLSRYPHEAEKIIVFDKHQDVSANDRERMQRAAEVPIDYELSITSPLPKRDAIMNSKNYKRKLASVLSTFTIADMTTTESRDDSAFDHYEADITMISYVIKAANCEKDVIRVLSDHTDVFVLLVYWVYREEMTSKVQMERWDGTELHINATCADLGPQCQQLLGMHAIIGCDTTSSLTPKGNSAL